MAPHKQFLLRQLSECAAEFEPRTLDAESEAIVRAAVAEYPTLPYWLAHRVVLLSVALENAEAEIEFLRNELRARAAERRSRAPSG